MTMGTEQTPSERRRSCLVSVLFCIGVTAVLVLTFDRLIPPEW